MNVTFRIGPALGALVCLLAMGLSTPASPRDDKPKTDEPKTADAKKEAPKKPPIYNSTLDARVQLEQAVARAKRDNSRVLVMFGFEGCSWCHKLHALFRENADIRKLLCNEYVLVMVDTESPHASELIKECKASLSKDDLEKGVGFPFLAVFGGDGKIVTAQRTEPLEEGKGHDPDRVKTFLTHNAVPKVNARIVLESALARAGKEDKRVFLHFGAPWCGWCHRLDDFLAQPEIASVIGTDYIDVKIDVDRMDNGKDVLETHCKKQSGIPWTVILDARGKDLANSDGPKGNIGFPYEPEEIEHFVGMLKQTARKLNATQIEQVGEALRKSRSEIEQQRGKQH
jgi:thioredoxin-related protein